MNSNNILLVYYRFRDSKIALQYRMSTNIMSRDKTNIYIDDYIQHKSLLLYDLK